MTNKSRIHLDNAATTYPDPIVQSNIAESIRTDWHNPSSIYEGGLEVRRKIEHAKEQIADAINCDPDEIYFTGSGSQSNNWALAMAYMLEDYTGTFSTRLEHPSIYNYRNYYLENYEYEKDEYSYVDSEQEKIEKYLADNWSWHYIDVDFNNETNIGESLEKAIKEKYEEMIHLYVDDFSDSRSPYWTKEEIMRWKPFVTMMSVNNELGTVNPLWAVSRVVHRYKGYLHVDLSQSIAHNRMVDVKDMGIDLATFSSHKMYMPRGLSVLYVNRDFPMKPFIYGGHQQNGMFAGTEPQYMIIAMGKQIQRLKESWKDRMDKEYELYFALKDAISSACQGICEYHYNVPKGIPVVPYIISVRFDGYDAQQLITMLDLEGVECSAGSACSSGSPEPSRVLKEIGLTDEEAKSTLRLSICHNNTVEEMEEFGKRLRKCLIMLSN